MDKDKRITGFRRVVRSLASGRFRLRVSVAGDDDVAQLGRDLDHLARTLERRFEEFKALARVTEKINAGLLVTEVLDHIFENFHRFIPYNRIGFALLEDDPAQGTLVRSHWARSDADDLKIAADYVAPLAGSSLAGIIATGEPRIINDLVAHLAAHPESSSTRLIVAEGIRSSLTCPLLAMGKPIGFLFFSSRLPSTYRNAHVEIFEEIAGQLSIIVEKSRLYQSLIELAQTRNRFLGMAAHDLRSPVVSLQRSLSLLRGDDGEPPAEEQRRQLLDRMQHSCRRVVLLVEDLLDVSAIDAGTLRLDRAALDLRALFLRVCLEMEPEARAKNIEWHCRVPDGLPPAWGDAARIEQVLENLLSNAVKFSYPGSTVTVTAGLDGDAMRITVADTGQGIAPGEIPKLFQAFGRTSARPTAGEPSTGLGLLISKRLVEAHGGRIWAESEAGLGTRVHFTLPAARTA